MADTETFDKKTPFCNVNTSDFPSMFMDLIKKINYKMIFFLSILCLFVFSDIFISLILTQIDGVDVDSPNNKGSIIQMMFIVVGYIILDLATQSDLL